MKRVEYDVEIRKALLDEEKEFIDECIRKPDFRTFISELWGEHSQDAFLFYYQDEILGVFWPQISDITGVVIATPSIYMIQRMSRFSVICIGKMLAYLFFNLNVEKVLMPVYSNNIAVINAMENYKLCLEGIFHSGLEVNGETVDICYYSILQNEIEDLKLVYKEIYGN